MFLQMRGFQQKLCHQIKKCLSLALILCFVHNMIVFSCCQMLPRLHIIDTVRKVSKNGVFSGLYFPGFSPNKVKYGSEKIPYLGIFHAVRVHKNAVKAFFIVNCDTLTVSISVILDTKKDAKFQRDLFLWVFAKFAKMSPARLNPALINSLKVPGNEIGFKLQFSSEIKLIR